MFSFTKNLLLIFVFIIFSSFLYSTILNVPGTFPTIQAGIDAAVDADTVLVQPGTYVENINYNGKNITVASLFLTTQDTIFISQTIIDGDSIDIVVKFENGEDPSALLTGFTITNGNSPVDGGGIYCSYSSPNLENLIVIDNITYHHGGGIGCDNSNPNLQDLRIIDNYAGFAGGGISCEGSSPNLLKVTIIGNNTDYAGGGISCENSNPNLENVTISDNSAGSYGGGVWSSGSNPSLVNSILWNDSPDEIYGSAGATYSDIQGGWEGTGNIDSDPLFADPANGNYHLTEDSPCIDAGDPASQLDPDGTITDMGAYFYPQFIPPEADFEADVILGEAPLEVQFSDLTVPNYNPILSWQWDFNNDGTIDSNEQNPVYVYEEIGVYTVSLTVSDGYMSDTEIKEDYIEVTGSGTELNIIPLETFLGSNYPNPFNPETTISFILTAKDAKNAKLEISNLKGQKVKLLVNRPLSAGQHSVVWNGKDDNGKQVASGVYFYKLQTETLSETRKMLLLK